MALLGEDHPHTLACAANLALDLRSIGDGVARSPKSVTKTIERYHRVLGDEHPDVKAVASGQRLDMSIDRMLPSNSLGQ